MSATWCHLLINSKRDTTEREKFWRTIRIFRIPSQWRRYLSIDFINWPFFMYPKIKLAKNFFYSLLMNFFLMFRNESFCQNDENEKERNNVKYFGFLKQTSNHINFAVERSPSSWFTIQFRWDEWMIYLMDYDQRLNNFSLLIFVHHWNLYLTATVAMTTSTSRINCWSHFIKIAILWITITECIVLVTQACKITEN